MSHFDLVRKIPSLRIAVMGDPMVDYYHFGRVDRLSPEAPVPVFIEGHVEQRKGGAANVVANLEALGCSVTRLFPPGPYTVKHRYVVGTQQIFRIDADRDHSQEEPTEPRCTDPLPDAFVISDYGKGWCTKKRCQWLIERAGAKDRPIIVDPKGLCWDKYKGATIVCPNEREILQEYDTWDGHILHKLGSRGMKLIYPDREEHPIPARARHVYDVTGAGDTVVAVLAAVLAAGGTYLESAELANMAAGVVVGEMGTSVCRADQLLEELTR